jgi:DNA-binding CsgD family transcriptional regulator/MFS family permease
LQTLDKNSALCLVLTSIGFALFHGWLLIPIFVMQPQLPLDDAYSWMRAGSIFALLILIMLGFIKTPQKVFIICLVLFASLLSIGSTSRMLIGFTIAGQIVSGFGFAGLFLSYGRHIATLPKKLAGTSIALSGVIASVLCICVSIFANEMSLAISSCFPPLSIILLLLAADDIFQKSGSNTNLNDGALPINFPDAPLAPANKTEKSHNSAKLKGKFRSELQLRDFLKIISQNLLEKPRFKVPWKLLAAVTVFSMIFEFALYVTVQESNTSFHSSTLVIFTCFGVSSAALLILELFLRRGVNISALYSLLAVVIFTALMLMSVLQNEYLFLPRIFTAAGFLLFWLLAVVMYSNMSGLPNSKKNVFAFGLIAEQIGELLGTALGHLGAIQTDQVVLGLSGTTVSAFCAALLLMIATLLIFNKRNVFSRDKQYEKPLESQPYLDLERICRLLCEKYGLSPRESDVLTLLARGRSNPLIASELYLSQSTINTHVKAIYAKINIHSRQELLNLIYTKEN